MGTVDIHGVAAMGRGDAVSHTGTRITTSGSIAERGAKVKKAMALTLVLFEPGVGEVRYVATDGYPDRRNSALPVFGLLGTG